MLKVLTFVLSLVVMALSVGMSAQNRPDFSGRWTLVPEKSTPTGSRGALGDSFGVQQTATTIAIETVVPTMSVSRSGGAVGTPEKGVAPRTAVYTFDGVEHELQQQPQLPPGVPPSSVQVKLIFETTYRAVWTTDQLVILTALKGAQGTQTAGQFQGLSRLSLSLDSDGSLVVDNLAINTPRPGGAKQEPPVSVRCIYKKLQ
jgi:hypothetical protein